MGNSNNKTTNKPCPDCPENCWVAQELVELRQEITRLKDLVRLDHLTGLFNVRYLMELLEQEIERTQRTQLPTTFILLDIDHFKSFNDTYGHVVGDKVLVHLATILNANVRKIDFACRYGGEEFAIVLPSTPLLVGVQVAERIRRMIESSSLQVDDQHLHITASFGVDCFFANTNETPKDFIARTDIQLYCAKQNGRNQVQHPKYKKSTKAQVSESEKEALFNQLQD